MLGTMERTSKAEKQGIGRHRSTRNSERLPYPNHHHGNERRRGISKSIFWHPPKQQTKANSRLENVESLYPKFYLSNGGNERSKEADSSKLLPCENRFERCLSEHSSEHKLSEIPLFQLPRENIQVSKNALWSQYCSQNLYSNNENRIETYERSRIQLCNVFGRYTNHCEYQINSRTTSLSNFESFGVTRFFSQHEKIDFPSHKPVGIPWEYNRYKCNDSIYSIFEVPENYSGFKINYQISFIPNKEISSNFRNDSIDLRINGRSFDTSALFTSKHFDVYQEACQLESTDTNIQQYQARSKNSDGNYQIQSWIEYNLERETDYSFIYRCFQNGIWIPYDQYELNGTMDISRERNVIELQGIENSVDCLKKELKEMEVQETHCSLRQHDNCEPNQLSEQSTLCTLAQNNQTYIPYSISESNRYPGGTHSRNREHSSRLSEPSMQRPKRMVSELENNESNNKKIRKDSIRPFCNTSKCKSVKIRIKNSMAKVIGNRCIPNETMARELPTKSTNRSAFPLSAKSENLAQPIINCGNAKLANTTLVSCLAQSFDKETTETELQDCSSQEKSDNETTIQRNSRLESIFQSKAKELDLDTIKTLNQAERKATKNTYDCMWKKFVQFCQERNKDSTQFDANLAANFLNKMLEISLSSFLQARSALSSTWYQMHPSMGRLSDYPIISKLSKAAKEIKPRKPKKEQNWNLQPVLDYLATIKNEDATLKEISHKSVVLLAIASFWRTRSDLSRIYLEDVSISQTGIEITATKPKEGEFKTTTINRFSNPAICPVRALERYLLMTENIRHPSAKNLFVQVNAPHKNCSSDTLGKWAEKVLKQAGIKTTAHKIRSASTSHALKAGVSIDKILQKANWRNVQTFKAHYLGPVLEGPVVRKNEVNDEHSRSEFELPIPPTPEVVNKKGQGETSEEKILKAHGSGARNQ